MNDEDEPEPAEPNLVCARLLACGKIRYDPADPDSGFTLERVLVHVRPHQTGYPFRAGINLIAQLHGTPGEYVLRVRVGLVRLTQAGGGEELIELESESNLGPWEIEIPGGSYVECFGLPLGKVQFTEPGVYEFQLWADGLDEMLMNERIEARE
jgi:hypothetical protein